MPAALGSAGSAGASGAPSPYSSRNNLEPKDPFGRPLPVLCAAAGAGSGFAAGKSTSGSISASENVRSPIARPDQACIGAHRVNM